MIKSDFHTHTCYCDGKDTPEDIVLSAIEKGFTSLGFSGHSYTDLDKEFAMNSDNAAEYKRVINLLKNQYHNKIKIYCGIEQDIFSHESTYGYDYVIGSVHYVQKGDELCAVDKSPEITKDTVNRLYGGDFDAYAEDYFAQVSNVIAKTNCDIIGHFDLVSKYSEINGYAQSERFLAAAEKAIKNLVKFKKPFEINTGAMARGSRSIPYPTPEILKIIKANGGSIMFSSDCHDKNNLDYAFDKAEKLALDCGFTKHAVITGSGIEYKEI